MLKLKERTGRLFLKCWSHKSRITPEKRSNTYFWNKANYLIPG